MKHISESHKTFQPCNKFQNNTCEYDEDCRYRHVKIKENEHLCYKCGETFTNKTLLMKHIKEAHGDIPCLKYIKGECRFSESSCFFRHGGPTSGSARQEVSGGVATLPAPRGFQWASPPQAPPDNLQEVVRVVVEATLKEVMPRIIQQITQMLQQK